MPPSSTVLEPLRDGPTSSTGLLRSLQLPPPRLARTLQTLQREGQVVQTGTLRRPHYALPRVVPGAGSCWPVYQVDAAGRVHELGRLSALMPRHFQFESPHAPLAGVSAGLPWFLQGLLCGDARSSGPMPHGAVESAGTAEDVQLAWLVRDAWDPPGDLLIGSQTQGVRRQHLDRLVALRSADRATHYPRLAAAVLENAQPRPHLAGPHPKFTVLLDHGGHRAHALVKFSPRLDTAEGERWADLLIAEHIAHGYLNSRGVGAAHSRAWRFEGRIFLEVDRFDRVGVEGCRGVVPLSAAQAAHGISDASWSGSGEALVTARALPRNDARQIRLIESFAALIGNAPTGPDNLSLFDRHDGTFALAPVYDMLPMVFAPQGDGSDVAAPMDFIAPQPDESARETWPHARRLAEGYWERLAGEPNLSAAFRALCVTALNAVRARS